MNQAMLWAFRHHYHSDKANAAIHQSPVRFSPLTFRLAESLSAEHWEDELPHDYRLIEEVLDHRGAYPEDRGRVEQDHADA